MRPVPMTRTDWSIAYRRVDIGEDIPAMKMAEGAA